MQIRWIVLMAAVPVAACIAGCSSSSPPAAPQSGTIPTGTAEITVNGQKLPPSQLVDCTFIQSMTTITTGDDAAGATVVVDNGGGLDAKSVDLRNLGGFTGSYLQSLGHDATVSMTGRTFTIAGTADGFDADNPSKRMARTFSIKASC